MEKLFHLSSETEYLPVPFRMALHSGRGGGEVAPPHLLEIRTRPAMLWCIMNNCAWQEVSGVTGVALVFVHLWVCVRLLHVMGPRNSGSFVEMNIHLIIEV